MSIHLFEFSQLDFRIFYRQCRALEIYTDLTFASLSQIRLMQGSPVLQGCFYEAQEQLWPDAFPGITNNFYQIWTQGLRVLSPVP